jgi:hypothetical protein
VKITFDRSKTAEALAISLARMDADATVGAVLVLGCDANGWTPEVLDPVLKKSRKPLFGGIFPELVQGKSRLRQGHILVGFPGPARVALLEELSRCPVPDLEAAIAAAWPTSAAGGTLFVVVDGLCAHISQLIDALFNEFGLELNYLGGGAGSMSLQQAPCVITQNGLKQDAAAVAMLGLASGIGVAHGWRSISDAFKVTQARGNLIETLDWRPALEVYREIVEAHAGVRLHADNFFAVAKAYPFGIAKLDAEMVVRDPISAKGDGLMCVGEIRSGAFVHILHGEPDTLIAAAGHASKLAVEALAGTRPSLKLFVDCISRVLFLEQRFDRELAVVSAGELPLVGMLSIGEIANSGRDYLEFYNKTTVVGLLDAGARGEG